jgi:putative copper resistance protein D
MFVFFLTPLINVAMLHMGLMEALNVLFLFGGTLFWWPMVGLDPIIHWKMGHPARMLNILLGSGIEAFLGVAILADAHPVASMYSLASTHAGGALLWTSTEAVTVGAFFPIFLQWTRSEERLARRADAASDLRSLAAVPVDEVVGSSREEPTRPLTPWEAEWFARTGSVPRNSGG